ncbi:unnamed protein product [Symbiodinium microadriaticum]|nr:unnamed protein product [Symbiodinium microadriaticum]
MDRAQKPCRSRRNQVLSPVMLRKHRCLNHRMADSAWLAASGLDGKVLGVLEGGCARARRIATRGIAALVSLRLPQGARRSASSTTGAKVAFHPRRCRAGPADGLLALDDGAGQEPLQNCSTGRNSADGTSASIAIDDRQLQHWEQQIHALVVVLVSTEHVRTSELQEEVLGLNDQGFEDGDWGYYGKWAAALAKLLLKQGIIDLDELDVALGGRSPKKVGETFKVGAAVRIKGPTQAGPASQWRRPYLPVPGSVAGLQGAVAKRLGLRSDDSFFALQKSLGLDMDATCKQYMYAVNIDPEALSTGSERIVTVEVSQCWLEALEPEAEADAKPSGAAKAPKAPKRRHLRQSLKTVAQSMHDFASKHAEFRKHGLEIHRHQGRHERHEHLPRSIVEAQAVEKEGREAPGQRVTEVLLQVLISRGILAMSAVSRAMEVIDSLGVHPVGPWIVARAWCDTSFKSLLLEDAHAAIELLGHEATSSTSTVKIKVVESTPWVHNLVVCTLCSCYPVTLLGLSPAWYKSREYREQAVQRPRELLRESFGLEIPQNVELRVHDSNSELRYIVLPQRPVGTEGWSEERLASMVTRDAMIGVALPDVAEAGEQRWKEEWISVAQVQPWKPSWERGKSENLSERAGGCTAVSCAEIAASQQPSLRRSMPQSHKPRHDQFRAGRHKSNTQRRIWRPKFSPEQSLALTDAIKPLSDVDAASETNTAATTSLHTEAICHEVFSQDGDVQSEQCCSETPDGVSGARRPSSDDCVGQILTLLRNESAKLLPLREELFGTVRDAAADALPSFERMALVGSVALTIDVPSSDVDAVVFTKTPVDAIQALNAMAALLRQKEPQLRVQVIDRARVPIIMVSTGDRMASLDLSVNRKLPDEHVSWFRSLRIFQEEQELVVDFLRCVKYWHSQRQIPGTKEGGYPILAWILFAVQRLQAFLAEETLNASHCGRLLAALDHFFQSLVWPADTHASMCGSSEEYIGSRIWPFPCVLDPVTPDVGNSNLIHEIPIATQILYADEFLRARALVAAAISGDGNAFARLFERESSTLLQASPFPGDSKGNGAYGCVAFVLKRQKIWLVEVLSVSKMREKWTAPFLHRCDSQTELQGCLLSVDGAGAVQRFPELRQGLTFSPRDFVACAELDHISQQTPSVRLTKGDLRRWQDLQKLQLLIQ